MFYKHIISNAHCTSSITHHPSPASALGLYPISVLQKNIQNLQNWGFCWANKNLKICTISVFSMSVTLIELGSFPNTQSLTYTWRESLRDILSRILNKPDQQCLDEWQKRFYHKKMIFCGTFFPFFSFKMDFSVIFFLHIFLRKFFKLQYLRHPESDLTFFKT